MRVRPCVRASMRACVSERVRPCVRACACARVCVYVCVCVCVSIEHLHKALNVHGDEVIESKLDQFQTRKEESFVIISFYDAGVCRPLFDGIRKKEDIGCRSF